MTNLADQNEKFYSYLLPEPKKQNSPRLVFCSLEEHIKYSVRSILLSRRGERIFSPEVGGNLSSFLFRQYQPSLIHSIKEEIEQILEQSEPRIIINSIEIHRDEIDLQLLKFSLNYKIRSSGRLDSVQVQMKP